MMVLRLKVQICIRDKQFALMLGKTNENQLNFT